MNRRNTKQTLIFYKRELLKYKLLLRSLGLKKRRQIIVCRLMIEVSRGRRDAF
jgi:hypothetical protein